MENQAPVGFETEPVESALFGGDLHRGPRAGMVASTWTSENGVMIDIDLPDGRDLSLAEAEQVRADLEHVLTRLRTTS